jgi:hypothetical protein
MVELDEDTWNPSLSDLLPCYTSSRPHWRDILGRRRSAPRSRQEDPLFLIYLPRVALRK